MERYQLKLVTVIGDPSPGDADVANITVTANDHAYGVFQLAVNSRTFVADEPTSDVSVAQLNVTIERLQGLFGTVEVCMQAHELAASSTAATIDVDFRLGDNTCAVFAPGVESETLPVLLLGDDTPELAERFLVRIASVRLLNTSNVQPGTDLLDIAAENEAIFTIRENDVARGRLAFVGTSLDVEEDTNTVMLTVARAAGLFGDITVAFVVTAKTATLGEDFAESGGNVSFAPDQDEGTITITILNDDIPEEDEVFEVTLTQAFGGAILGNPTSFDIRIRANDAAFGVIQFAPSELAGIIAIEPEVEPLAINVTLIRERGLFGTVTVDWQLNSSVDLSLDVTPLQGTVTFAQGVSKAVIGLQVLPDAIPEVRGYVHHLLCCL